MKPSENIFITMLEPRSALEEFKKLSCKMQQHIESFERAFRSRSRWRDDKALCDTAVNALERLIPKSVDRASPVHGTASTLCFCQMCGAMVEREFHFCSECGQAILWEDTND